MADYALLTFAGEDGRPRAGLRVGEEVLDLAALGTADGIDYGTTLSILNDWELAEPALERLAADAAAGSAPTATAPRRLDDVTLLAPILYPGAIFCAAANYTDHMKEMSGREPPDKATTRPYFFIKSPLHCVIGPNATIRLPKISKQVDWEAEIGAVIGKPGRNISEADAMDHVAGYTIVNDLSLRDLGKRQDWNFGSDWLGQKNFETGAPMGPWIVPAKSFGDFYNLSIKLWVNDELHQDTSTKFMHFDVAEQIAYLSERFTLHPGDVIATGTGSGVGRPKGIFLKPGDEVTIEVEGIGRMRNPVEAGE